MQGLTDVSLDAETKVQMEARAKQSCEVSKAVHKAECESEAREAKSKIEEEKRDAANKALCEAARSGDAAGIKAAENDAQLNVVYEKVCPDVPQKYCNAVLKEKDFDKAKKLVDLHIYILSAAEKMCPNVKAEYDKLREEFSAAEEAAEAAKEAAYEKEKGRVIAETNAYIKRCNKGKDEPGDVGCITGYEHTESPQCATGHGDMPSIAEENGFSITGAPKIFITNTTFNDKYLCYKVYPVKRISGRLSPRSVESF